MLISIRHSTHYTYAGEASYSIQSLRLTPRDFDGQTALQWDVTVPGVEVDSCSRDGFGNIVQLVAITTPHREVEVRVSGQVEVEDRNGVVRGIRDACLPRVYLRETPLTASDPALAELGEAARCDTVLDSLHSLSALIRERIDYEVGATHAHTCAAEALADGKGVCQDHAHVFIASARHLDVPARYVTGYLVTSEEDESEAHHAWAEAWVHDLGWVGFDVTNGHCPTERYVRLACGLDARYAAPVRGSRRGGDDESLDVNVVVEQTCPQQ